MTTTFTDGSTVITAAWLNAADAIVTAHAISALQPLSPAANKIAYYTGASSAALADISDYMIGLLSAADSGAFTTTLDPQLAAIAALVPTGPHQLVSFTGLTTVELLTVSSFMLDALDDTTMTQLATTLGLDAYISGKWLPLAGGTMSGDIDMGNVDLKNANNVSFHGIYDAGNSGTAKTIDFSANGQYQKITMTGNCTFTFTAPPGPCVLHLDIYQDGTGSRVMTLPGTVKWPSTYVSADKLLTTTASARDLLLLRYDGTNYIANLLPGIA